MSLARDLSRVKSLVEHELANDIWDVRRLPGI